MISGPVKKRDVEYSISDCSGEVKKLKIRKYSVKWAV